MQKKISTSLEQQPRRGADDFVSQMFLKQETDKENSEEWKSSLEYALRTTDWILNKVRQCDDYAIMLYSALCNNEFIRNETFDLLAEKTWGCSWRYAAGIIAHMREIGDYMDWYCSSNGREGEVSDEIAEDLLKLGWVVKY